MIAEQILKPTKSPGEIAYYADVAKCPRYHDGARRKTWGEVPPFARQHWEKLARQDAVRG
jgi:hypothetical protein